MIARRFISTLLSSTLVATVAAIAVPTPAFAAATIVIVNNDGAGEGFNDPTPVAPVGGNPGTTLGQQRLNVFQAAANIWGATLTSVPVITVRSNFDPLSCTATSAVLGSAGARFINRDFTGAPLAGTWYGEALANRLAGVDTIPNEPEISARFNSSLGQANCLTGSFFYLGTDGNVPAGQVHLLAVVLHELAHGLGFQTFTNGTTGAQNGGFPAVYDYFLHDNTVNLNWNQMTNTQRVASAINARRLVWDGANVTTALPSVLSLGTPELLATAPASLAGSYLVGAASFGPQLSASGVSGEVMPVVTQIAANGNACDPFNAMNTLAVSGKIALVDRGVCGFAIKVKNAQNAGAIGVLVADNVAGSPPAGLGGSDPSITIPSVRITLADGNKFKDALKYRSRTRSGVFVTLRVDMSTYAGADPSGHALMYTPNPFQSGSSVSHFDTSAFRNLLMEPAINGDLTLNVAPPFDLTFSLLKDIGWQ